MARVEKSVFLSYRRLNFSWALLIEVKLSQKGYDVFLDYNSIASGDFGRAILENIRNRAHFIVVLTPEAVTRFNEPNDWMRREIEEAIESRRNVIPLMLDKFDFRTPAIAEQLTGKLEVLSRYNAIAVPQEYFNEAMQKLCDRFLDRPLDTVLHPISGFAQEIARQQQAASSSASIPAEIQAIANEWVNRGKASSDNDEQLQCYGNAIRSNPYLLIAYFLRGELHECMRHYREAEQDYSECIRLKSNFSEAYYRRARVREYENPKDALEDYNEFIRLEPDGGNGKAYEWRSRVRRDLGDKEGQEDDRRIARRINPGIADRIALDRPGRTVEDELARYKGFGVSGSPTKR